MGSGQIPKGNQPRGASSDDCDFHLIVFRKVLISTFWKRCRVDVVRIRGQVGHEEKESEF